MPQAEIKDAVLSTIADVLHLRCGTTLSNRIAKSATSEGLADAMGRPTRDLERLYQNWAKGGFGLIVTGNVIVDRGHLERAGNVVIDDDPTDEQLAALRSWASSARRVGGHVWAQLSHAGRQTPLAINAHPLSASAVAMDLPDHPIGKPDEILNAEIDWVIGKFAAAARVCRAVGFTGVQVQAGQGHLISSFLNPASNKREDQWGGSLDNRLRLLLSVVEGIRSNTGASFPIGVKLEAADLIDPRGRSTEGEQIVEALEAAGVDLIEISCGADDSLALVGEATDDDAIAPTSGASAVGKSKMALVEFAASMRRRGPTAFMLTGGFRTLASMQAALEQGVDMVGVARPACVDPLAVKRLLAGDVDELESWERHDRRSREGPSRKPLAFLFRRPRPRAETRWFQAQLYRLARGEAAATELSAAKAASEVADIEHGLVAERNKLGNKLMDNAPNSSAKGPTEITATIADAHAVERPRAQPQRTLFARFKSGVMGVWYLHVRSLNRLWPSITIRGRRLAILPGVYKPLENEFACAEYCRAGERVLDLGSGSGVCSIFCSPIAGQVVAVDISAAAVKNTSENCARLGLTNVSALRSDMFSRVEGRFDLIIANAPYIAADFDDDEEQFATSVRYLPTLFAQATDHLTSDGRLLIQFPFWFRKRIERLADRHGLRVVSMRRLPRKSFGLSLLSLAYLQVGFRSTYFLLQPRPAEPTWRKRLAA